MNNVGYSGKPLISKLGYKPGDSVYLIAAPESFKTYLENESIRTVDSLPTTWLHGFFSSSLEIANFLQFIDLNEIEKGMWLSWPKKSSGIKNDVTEQTFRDLILPLGWVDTKVCAVDETWSGLLFYRRKH